MHVTFSDVLGQRGVITPREAATLTLAVGRAWDRQKSMRGDVGLPDASAIALHDNGEISFLLTPGNGEGIASLSALLALLLGVDETDAPPQRVPGGLLITIAGRLGQLDLPSGKVTLDILVENMGRINFGPNLLKNNKGIVGTVLLGNTELKGWQMFSLPFNKIQAVVFSGNKKTTDAPVIKKGVFSLAETGDTYLDMSSWGKGCVWINGHHLGRYWEIGPQQTIYVPVEWLRKGNNEIEVLELIKPNQDRLNSIEKPILNKLSYPNTQTRNKI